MKIYAFLFGLTFIVCSAQNNMGKDEIVLTASMDAEKFSMDPPSQDDFNLYFYLESDIIFLKHTQKEYTGSIKIIYPTGEDYAVWNYLDGRLEGEQLLFHRSGGKLALFHFKNNKAEGEQYNYYEDGETPLNQYTFKNGRIDGHTIYYYRNGNREKEGYSKGQNILDEKLTGHWIYYYENGNKKEEGNWSIGGRHEDDNIQTGRWEYYDENGTLIKTIEYDRFGRQTGGSGQQNEPTKSESAIQQMTTNNRSALTDHT